MSTNLFFLFLPNFFPDFPIKEQKIGRNFFLFKVNEYKKVKKSGANDIEDNYKFIFPKREL